MNLKPYSWDGKVFADYALEAFIPDSPPLAYPASAVISERGGLTPQSVDRRYTSAVTTVLQVQMTGDYADQPDDVIILQDWFQTIGILNGRDINFHTLIAHDLDNSNKPWKLLCAPLTLTKDNDSVVVVLLTREPYWKAYDVESSAWTITGTGDQETITTLGKKALPIFRIKPTAAKSTGNNYYRFVDVQPPSTTIELGRFPLDIGAGLNTAALVSGGKAQASGNDFRVWVDGFEVWRGFGGTFNTSATKIWTCLVWKPKVTLELGTAILATGTLDYIQFKNDTTNRAALSRLPRNGIIKIGSEYFVYADKDLVLNRVTKGENDVLGRSAKFSTAAAHSVGATCTWIQHDIVLICGNAAQAAPVYDDSFAPMFDLAASSNTLWVFNEFLDFTKPRTMAWSPGGGSKYINLSSVYYASEGGVGVTTVTDAGMKFVAGKIGADWHFDGGMFWWRLDSPGLFTSVSASGKRFRNYDGIYPTIQLWKSFDGLDVAIIATIADPTVADTWESWSVGSTSLGGSYPVIQFAFNGQIPTPPPYADTAWEADVEAATISVVPDSSITPAVVVGSEAVQYDLDCTITDLTNGQAFGLKAPVFLNVELVLDCERRRVYQADGTPIQSAFRRLGGQVPWMEFVEGANLLQFDDANTTAMTITVERYSRTFLKP